MRIVIYLVVFVFIGYPFCHEAETMLAKERIKSSDKVLNTTKYASQEYPEHVRQIASKAKKVYKNQDGFWEAEFNQGIIMVYIPPGKFQQGWLGEHGIEKPVRSVHQGGYWIGKYEITFDQFDRFCEEKRTAKPDDEGWGRGRRPVINISWADAMKYCRWISERTGCHFTLPSDLQWEKAARGTDGRTYPWGNSRPTGNDANFADSSTNFEWKENTVTDNSRYTAPVGSYMEGSSPYGVLDMAGNVYEWCYDWYSSSFNLNSKKQKKGTYRIIRGGSWYTSVRCLKTAFRTAAKPTSRYFHIGFRVCSVSENQ